MTVLQHTNMINVFMAPHPFAMERIDAKIAEGKTVDDIISELQPDKFFSSYAHVYVNGEYIERECWCKKMPKAGDVVSIRMIPQGGGGSKNPLRTVLALAVMAGTGFLASGATSILGGLSIFGFNVSGIVAGGVNLLGKLVLNAIAPPSSSKYSSSKESATLFIQGARNKVNAFGRVPKVLGKHRFVPPLGALPYTEIVGDDQYLRMLFIWGYGPLVISDLKIGETPIEEFDDVEIETRYGYEDDAAITLYSNSVLQDDLQIYLEQEDGWVVRSTEEDADEISIDITFPNGLVLFSGSTKTATTVLLDVQYAPAGTENWIQVGTSSPAISITAQQSAALRKGLRWTVEKGKYDVRVKRITKDNEDNDNLFDYSVWTALRTIRYQDPINKKSLAVTALRIKATDQLNGVIDRFNGVVSAVIPDWTGEEWIERETSNPASIYRHVLQGSANARPLSDSRIDLDKIQEWHENCADNEREFNAVIDYDTSVREVLHDIASAGRASPSFIDGKWGVIEDKIRTAPVQHFTPRNSFDFKGEKIFDDLPQGLRVRFINREKGWVQDERLVFDDGYNQETASKYETLDLTGVTDSDQAWRDGRYHLATARLRPETYSFYTDIEHIVCTRGDLIRFTHDVPMFGLMSARVNEIIADESGISGVVIDAEIEMEEGKSYCARFRKSDGESLEVSLVNASSEKTCVLEFLYVLADDCGIAVGDLLMFGEEGEESAALIVKSIKPQGDLKAKITCVAYNENIFKADSEDIPEFVSYIETTGSLERLPVPELKQIQSGLETVIKHTDGSITSRILITLVPPSNIGYDLNISVKIKTSDETVYRNATTISRYDREVSVTDIDEGEAYDIQLRYYDNSGTMSAPLNISNYRVEGTTSLPSDVQSLNMSVLGDNVYLSWEAVSDIDLSHYTLRFSSSVSGVTWGGAIDLVTSISKDATSISVPVMVGTYLLKAVDAGGRESANAVAVISDMAGIYSFNAVAELIENPSFVGEKDCTAVIDDVLTLIGKDDVDDWVIFDDVVDSDIGESGIVSKGIYYFANDVDLGEVYTSRVTAEMDVVGTDVYDIIDTISVVDNIESWDNSLDPSLFNVVLQLRTSNDNEIWSDWKNFVVGDYCTRAYQFRAVLESYSTTIAPKISTLKVKVDMPDRVESQEDVISNVGGISVAFVKAFKAKPALSITAQSMQSGDYYALDTITNSGFNICFYNSSGETISRSFDYIAKGYGLNN